MHARITAFRIKPEEREAALGKVEQMKPRILGLPGMQHFILVADSDGNGYVISLIDSEAVSAPGNDQIKAIWSEILPHLAAPPEAPRTCEVLAEFES